MVITFLRIVYGHISYLVKAANAFADSTCCLSAPIGALGMPEAALGQWNGEACRGQ
jgi:hypothetical protein